MKLKDILNLKNVKSFIEGNINYYSDKLNLLPPHIREQVLFRLEKCKDDCVKTGKCKECGCPVEKKVFVSESCNEGKRFPDFMDNKEWEDFKIKNGYE